MIEAMIVAAGYVAYFSSAPGAESVARPLIFVLLLLAALMAIMGKKVKPIMPTASELLLYAIGIVSCAVALVRSVDYSIYYSMYFLTAIICISVIARTLPLEQLLDLAALCMLACAVTTVIVYWRELLTCLSISVGKNGLIRFMPFSSHPLLVGYVFGSGSILLIRRAYLARCMGALCDGGRGGTRLERGPCRIRPVRGRRAVGRGPAWPSPSSAFSRTALRRAGMIAIIAGMVVVAYFAVTSPYLQQILEVSSDTRGIGSGVTGRTDLWEKGLMSLTSDPTLVAFGGGLRSSEYSVIGFLTENSYITILLDSGALLGSALILFLMLAPFNALRQSRVSSDKPNALILLPSFFVFLLVQCFFVRYLVGLGNPTALYTLIFFTGLSMRPGFEQSLAHQAPAPGSMAPLERASG